MAKIFVTKDLIDIEKAFDDLALIDDETMKDMLQAAATITKKQLEINSDVMLHGKYWKGDLKKSLRIGRMYRTKDGGRMRVYFEGTTKPDDEHHSKPERLAAIAYINEYGKKSQDARPFLRKAVEQSSHEALTAAFDIYEKKLNKFYNS